MISDEDLFYLFEKTFGVYGNLGGKVDFIKDILRRYKAMGEPVCECVTVWLVTVLECCVCAGIALCCYTDVLC